MNCDCLKCDSSIKKINKINTANLDAEFIMEIGAKKKSATKKDTPGNKK